MWKLGLWSRKGGVGKSTLASSLAVFAATNGVQIALVDTDPQGSIVAWDRQRTSGSPLVLSASCMRLSEPLVLAAAEGYVGAIVDFPGALGPDEVKALALLDLVLVPTRPSSFDYVATLESLNVLAANGVRSAVVMTMVRPRRPMYPPHRETAQTRAALSKRALVLKTSIGARIDFQDAVAAGLGVTEYAKSSAAGDELRNLYADIVRTLNAK